MTNAQTPGLQTPFEKGNGNQTATYQQTIAYYKLLDDAFETISMQEMGPTDSGDRLHLVTFDPDKRFNFGSTDKAILLLNNGIHPGEPDGIDATMMLLRDLATGNINAPANVMIAAVPVYNIGGMRNRNAYSRANQNGPEQYGFRGNARNFDLNRDFIKCDTRDSRSFAEIFHSVNPDVFIDNHVSNGADYQYTFTYIATHPQKLGGALGQFWNLEMIPALMSDLKRKNIEPVPYVNVHDEKPDTGFDQFMDYPRYSTGFAALFNTLGSMPETHMLKDYASRVRVTYEYMATSIDYIDKHASKIKQLRRENNNAYAVGNKYPLIWEIDRSVISEIPFLGYEAGHKQSDVSGKPRLYYDRNKPFEKNIPYYKHYKPTLDIVIPKAYVIPKSWWTIIELLKTNHIAMKPLENDVELDVESYRIGTFKTAPSAFEGHYLHSDVKMTTRAQKILFSKGDWIVETQQVGVKYLLEMLEPQGVDSFFAWNFFDSVLQQKEYFSNYVFEDSAKELLEKNPELRSAFEHQKKSDKAFNESAQAQLEWIYRHSEFYEKSHMEYPVYRILK